MTQQIEQWDFIELTLQGPRDGNPFTDVTVGATFAYEHRKVDVAGFYDGEGVYKVRFMPDTVGGWTYQTTSNNDSLAGQTGEFECVPATGDNHGPVGVVKQFHFAYADGTPYVQVGTTCYVWNHQPAELIAQTLETLESAPFNKIRMCVFPKRFLYNENDPELYPFEGEPLKDWDFTRFNPAYFKHLESLVAALRDLNIEADIILFHPYDHGRWGFDHMDAASDDRYLRYVVARLSAYRNVWWSMANEFDLMPSKDMHDWDRFFQVVQQADPYQHLRSIHNCKEFYDHNKPWVTHCSIQRTDTARAEEWRETYGKPVVIDEMCYEGDVHMSWGNSPAEVMLERFWDAMVRGGYAGHGETFLHEDDVLWWSKGGVLHGKSPERIAFMRRIFEDAPHGISPVDIVGQPWMRDGGHVGDDYFICYFGHRQPAQMQFHLPEDKSYRVDILDTWNMEITTLDDTISGKTMVPMPFQQWMAVRLVAVDE